MLSHSKIVVGTPDRHVLSPATGIQGCAGKPASPPLQIGEDPVPPLPTQLIEPLAEIRLIIHEPPGAAILIRILGGLAPSQTVAKPTSWHTSIHENRRGTG